MKVHIQTMGTEKVKTKIRKDQIAQAILRLVADQGLKGLNVAAVARQVDLVPSALYRHFKGKEEMVAAALEIIRRRLLGNIDAVCRETGDALERLRLLLGRHLEMIGESQAIPRLIFSEDVYAGHPQRKKKVYHLLRTFLSRVADIVRQGQETGQLRQNINPKIVAVMFLGLFQPAAVLWYLSEGRYDVRKHADTVWPLFREAVKGGEPASPPENNGPDPISLFPVHFMKEERKSR
jgi:AcrR family transcriptional regulator